MITQRKKNSTVHVADSCFLAVVQNQDGTFIQSQTDDKNCEWREVYTSSTSILDPSINSLYVYRIFYRKPITHSVTQTNVQERRVCVDQQRPKIALSCCDKNLIKWLVKKL